MKRKVAPTKASPLSMGYRKPAFLSGVASQQFIGKSATVAVDPENGTITTTWCTGSRTKRKYLKKG